jgi:hypothetical protein
MQRISSFFCAAALCAVALGAVPALHAAPLIIDEDPEVAAEAEAKRKRNVNILDTSGLSNTSAGALQTLRELQERRPGHVFLRQPGLSEGGGRMGVAPQGATRTSSLDANGPVYAEFGATGLFGSGFNAEAVARERVPEFMSDEAAGVQARPQAYIDPDAPDASHRNLTGGGTYNVSGESAAPLDRKPGLLSTLLALVREYRVAVIGSALMLLVVALAASFAAKQSR